MKTTKSILMKSAWSIFRMQDVTFSEALILAWKNLKSNLKAVIVKSNKLVKSAGLGYETIYFNELVFTQISTVRTVVDNSGASAYYNCGEFNND